MCVRWITCLALFTVLPLSAQPGMPVGVWEDPNSLVFQFIQHDASTGSLSVIAPLPGVQGFVLGNKTTVDQAASVYVFVGWDGTAARLYSVELGTGSVLSDPLLPDNVVGLVHRMADSTIYGLREIGVSYDLVSVDRVTGLVTSIGPLPDVDAYVGDSFFMDQVPGEYGLLVLDGGAIRHRRYRAADASLVLDVPFPDPLTGWVYSCQDSSTYALWETGGQYLFERIDPLGTHATVSVLNGITPGFVANSASVDPSGVYTYRGFDAGNAMALIAIDTDNGAVLQASPTTDNATGFEAGTTCTLLPTGSGEPAGTGPPEVLWTLDRGMLAIRTSETVEQVRIVDQAGRRHDPSVSIDVGMVKVQGLSPGMYLVQLLTEHAMRVVPVVITP